MKAMDTTDDGAFVSLGGVARGSIRFSHSTFNTCFACYDSVAFLRFQIPFCFTSGIQPMISWSAVHCSMMVHSQRRILRFTYHPNKSTLFPFVLCVCMRASCLTDAYFLL